MCHYYITRSFARSLRTLLFFKNAYFNVLHSSFSRSLHLCEKLLQYTKVVVHDAMRSSCLLQERHFIDQSSTASFATLNIVLNVDSTDDIILVSKEGLGVRRLASELALPAFLSSVNSATEPTLQLLPARLHASSSNRDPVYIAANLEWQLPSTAVLPDESRIGVQKAWNTPLVSRKLEDVIIFAQTQVGRARLIAAAAPHSGDCLHAIPCSAVGT